MYADYFFIFKPKKLLYAYQIRRGRDFDYVGIVKSRKKEAAPLTRPWGDPAFCERTRPLDWKRTVPHQRRSVYGQTYS